MLKFWSSSLDSDGIYLHGFSKIFNQDTDTDLYREFITRLKNTVHNSASIPVFTLIGDFSHQNSGINQLFDMLRVSVNTTALLRSIHELDTYLSSDKKVIWSLNDDVKSDRFNLKQSFCFLYSLPGFPLIRHAEEFNLIKNESNISKSYIESVLSDEDSIENFFRLFNEIVKPKLKDNKPDFSKTTTTTESPWTTSNPRPEPFKNSFKSVSEAYLTETDIFNITVHFKSVLKVTRQINSCQTRGFKFYRNVVFLFNFSPFNIPIDKLIQIPGNFRSAYTNRSPFHVLYDSSKTLPEFLKVDDRNNLGLDYLKKGQYLTLEF